METPDIFQGLESIGQWESFWWGSRWELTNDEVDRALAKIDVTRNASASLGGIATVLAGVIFPGIGSLVAGGATTAIVGLNELLKSRIKSVNQGHGVIIDFAMDPTESIPLPDWGISQTLGLNLSNVQPRKPDEAT